MNEINQPQQSDGWLRARCGRITGSKLVDVCDFVLKGSAKRGDKKPISTAVAPSELKLDSLTVVKHFDKSSTAIFNMMRLNRKFKTVELEFADPTHVPLIGMSALPVMKIVLADGFFESATLSASESGKGLAMSQEIVMTFPKMALIYSADHLRLLFPFRYLHSLKVYTDCLSG